MDRREIFSVLKISKQTNFDEKKIIFSCPYQNCTKRYSVYSRYIVHIRTHVQIFNFYFYRPAKSLLNVLYAKSPSMKKEI